MVRYNRGGWSAYLARCCLVILCAFAPAYSAGAQDPAAPTKQFLEASGASRLSTNDLIALHVGRTIYVTSERDGYRDLAAYYDATGMRALRIRGAIFRGPYSIADDQRCEASVLGGTVCMTVYRLADVIWMCDPRHGDQCRMRLSRTVEGNPEGF